MRAENLLAKPLHQLVEHPLSLGVAEPVALEVPHLSGRVGWQRVEEGLSHPGVLVVLERERRSLALDDLLESLADLLERAGEVQGRLLLPAPAPPSRPQPVEPGE